MQHDALRDQQDAEEHHGRERHRAHRADTAAKPANHPRSVTRRARCSHEPQCVDDQPDRDRQADDQPRRAPAARERAPGRPRSTPRHPTRRRRGHPSGAERLRWAHDLDAQSPHGEHHRRQGPTPANPHAPAAARPPGPRLVLRARRAGAAAPRRARDHDRHRGGRRVRHDDPARVRSTWRPGRAHHDLRPRRPARPRPPRLTDGTTGPSRRPVAPTPTSALVNVDANGERSWAGSGRAPPPHAPPLRAGRGPVHVVSKPPSTGRAMPFT